MNVDDDLPLLDVRELICMGGNFQATAGSQDSDVSSRKQ